MCFILLVSDYHYLLIESKLRSMATIPNGWAAAQGSPVTVLLGAQWGDEGKGKIIDFLIQHNQVGLIYGQQCVNLIPFRLTLLQDAKEEITLDTL